MLHALSHLYCLVFYKYSVLCIFNEAVFASKLYSSEWELAGTMTTDSYYSDVQNIVVLLVTPFNTNSYYSDVQNIVVLLVTPFNTKPGSEPYITK
jgi:hypothetical protein